MKLVYAASAALLLLAPSIQGQSIPSLPACANSCVSQVCTGFGYATTLTCFCDVSVNITRCIGSSCDTSDQNTAVTTLDNACGSAPLTIELIVAHFNYSSPLSSLSAGMSSTATASGTSTTATSSSSSTSTAKSSAGRMMPQGGLVAVWISVPATLIAIAVYCL